MELIDNLKSKADQAESKEEARKFIEQSGLKLTDDELETVAGGYVAFGNNTLCEFDPSCHFAFTKFCNSCDKRG